MPLLPEKTPNAVIEDGPPPSDDEQDQLKWRGDPKETFSDWKIEIVHTDNSEKVDTYHVHKFVLAYGARRSEYFARLFRSGYRETQSRTSRLELEPLAAAAFPHLLDHLYKSPLAIETQTATALHSLADYLEMRRLLWDAKQFIVQDLSLKTMLTYYEHSRDLCSGVVQDLLARFVGQNILAMDPNSTIVTTSDPQLWLDVLKWIELDREANDNPEDEEDPDDASLLSQHWSRIVANLDATALDAGTLQVLTQRSTMAHVDPRVALALCELDDQFSAEDDNSEVNTSVQDDTNASSAIEPLQQRCATALSNHWRKLASSDDATREALSSRKKSFLVDLLVSSLKKSRLALEDCRHQLRESSKLTPEQPNIHMQTMSSLLKQVKQQVKTIGALRYERDEANKKLEEANQKLKNFSPLSPPARGDLALCTVAFPDELQGVVSGVGLAVGCNCGQYGGEPLDLPLFVYRDMRS